MSRNRRLTIKASLAILALGLVALSTPAQGPDGRYWRLDDIHFKFAEWEANYPDIFRVDTLGFSGLGEAIPLGRVSGNVHQDEEEPRLLFHAAQHANEANGTGAVMKSIERLLRDYDDDPTVRARVEDLELCFAPVINVDGHRLVFAGVPNWQDWRKTLRDYDADDIADFPDDGVDTHRNWDWFWEDYDSGDPQKDKGPFPFSESEVLALRDFVLAERPLLVVDYHSPVTISWSNYVFWPWLSQHGWGESPDAAVFGPIAEAWAANTLTETGGHFNAIWAWDTLPKEQCWVYGNTGILTLVMEIADHCWWSGATVDSIATRVARGSEYLQDRALNGPGIRGCVTDAATGLPLVAEVEIVQLHGDEVGPHLSETSFGAFYRFTQASYYDLIVRCEGYVDQSREVSVSGGGWTRADFELEQDTTQVWEGDTAATWLRFRNPLVATDPILLSLPAGRAPARLELIDIQGRRVALLGEALAPGLVHTLDLPSTLPAGVYLLSVRSGDLQAARRVTLLR
jgi:hypothetical protein